MAWQDTATQLLGGQASAVINRLQSINPNYDWSRVIQQYVPVLNQAYGSDWQDPGRGSSEGLVSALLQNAQADGQDWAASQLPAQQQRQQQQQDQIQKSQYHPSGSGLGSLLSLGALGLGGFGLAGMGPLSGLGSLFGSAAGAGATDYAASSLAGANMGFTGGSAAAGGAGISMPSLGTMANGLSLANGVTSLTGGGGETLSNYPDMNYESSGNNPNDGIGNGTGYNYPDMNSEYSGGDSPEDWNDPADPSGNNGLGNLFRNVFGNNGAGGYQFPWSQAIGSLFGAVGQNNAAKTLAGSIDRAAELADPFRAQRPFYQGQLQQMYTDPNYFTNSPVMRGLVDDSTNQMQRKLASQGYNYAGNTPAELTKLATNESFKYAQNQQNMTAGAAGAGFGPGQAGTIAGQGALAQPALNNQMFGNIGVGLGSIFQGNQPTAAQQTNGASRNQTLGDVFRTSL